MKCNHLSLDLVIVKDTQHVSNCPCQSATTNACQQLPHLSNCQYTLAIANARQQLPHVSDNCQCKSAITANGRQHHLVLLGHVQITFLVLLLVGQNFGEMVTRAAFKLPPQYLQLLHLQPQDWPWPQVGRAASVLTFVYPMQPPSQELESQPNALTLGSTVTQQRNTIENSKELNNDVRPVNVVQDGRPSYSPFYGLPQSPMQLRLLEPSISSINPFPVYSQTRVQDEKGGYFFSYSGGPSSRMEHRNHEGVVRGTYSFVDPHGDLKIYNYIADRNGYRVTTDQTDTGTSQQLIQSFRSIPNILYTRSKRSIKGYF
ncbi:Insect cuticle protein [Trinorchestia longiramus]|nr:Insect cuticle protein [Trinorchestia longiramus]